jgi:hypothetical protein
VLTGEKVIGVGDASGMFPVNSATCKYYDEMINQFDSSDSIHDKKKALYLTIVSIQILEAVRFYVSFACSYYFATKQKMIGNSKIIQLINRDENLYLGFTKELINILRTREDEGGVEVVKECEHLVQQMWKDAAEEETGATFLGCIRMRRILLTNISLRVVKEPASELKPPSFNIKYPFIHLIPRLSLSASSTL